MKTTHKPREKAILFALLIASTAILASAENQLVFGDPTVEYDADGCPIKLSFPITNQLGNLDDVTAYLDPVGYLEDDVCVTDRMVPYGDLQYGETATASDKFDLRVCMDGPVRLTRTVYYGYEGEINHQSDTVTVDASSCRRECPEPDFTVWGVDVLTYNELYSPQSFKVTLMNTGGGVAYNTKATLYPLSEGVTVFNALSKCPSGSGTRIQPGETRTCDTPYIINVASLENPLNFKLRVDWTNCYDEEGSGQGQEYVYFTLPNTGLPNLRITEFKITPL